jgi:nitrogen fixation NifU-like protein
VDELTELYQEAILDHSASPRNHGALPSATHQAEGFNPMCGDQYVVRLRMNQEQVEAVAFEGAGCAISKAACSMMTTMVKGKTRAEALALFEAFRNMVTGNPEAGAAELGKLVVFAGVSAHPMRVKCATLAWHTLRAALQGLPVACSTEE